MVPSWPTVVDPLYRIGGCGHKTGIARILGEISGSGLSAGGRSERSVWNGRVAECLSLGKAKKTSPEKMSVEVEAISSQTGHIAELFVTAHVQVRAFREQEW